MTTNSSQNPFFFLPGRIWSGIVSETRFKQSADSINIQFYNLSIHFVNKNENCFQISLNYKKINDETFKKEFGNLYILPDGTIRGQDINGFIDGRIFEKDNTKRMEVFYRSTQKSNDSMLSYYGELELKN